MRRIEELERTTADLKTAVNANPNTGYIKELARRIASGDRSALREHNRRFRESMKRRAS